MKQTGYDQFFKQAKKNSGKPVKNISMDKLRENITTQNNAKKIKTAKRKFPMIQFVVFLFCGLGLFLLIENFDQIESTLQKIEVGLGVAQAETTPVASAAAVAPAVAAAVSASTSVTEAVKPESTDGDDSDYIYKLTERKKILDQREEELNKKSAEIENQKLAIEKKLKELEDYRLKISTMLQERIKSDSGKVETLVQVYSNMKPNQAAKIFEAMDEDLVIEILSRMKKKSAADILNLIKTEKAQTFAERYAGYRMPASTASNTVKPDTEAAPVEPNSEVQKNP